MAYDYSDIKVSGVDMTQIHHLKIIEKIGEHSILELTGMIKETKKGSLPDILAVNEKQEVSVYLKNDKEKKKVLFTGILKNVKVQSQNGFMMATITVISATVKMDQKKRSRTFQDSSMTFHQLIKKVVSAYQDCDCIIEIPDAPIQDMIVQYEETDWMFIKRLVSQFGEGLFVISNQKGVHFYAGVPEIKLKESKVHTATFEQDLDGYYRRAAESKKNLPKASDYIIYHGTTSDVLQIGSCITHNRQKFYVREVRIEVKKSLLQIEFSAQPKAGIRIRPIDPMQIVGTALGGTIIQTQKDKVKVHFDIDEKQDIASAKFIPYSTMSASSDGSGWYCMPEIGDAVRVSFPTKYTKDVIALSSVSEPSPKSAQKNVANHNNTNNTNLGQGAQNTSGGGTDRMGDPNVVFLSTIHGKEFKLTPNEAVLTCAGGAAMLSMNNDGDIVLSSTKSIEVNADETIEIKSEGDLILNSEEYIALSCDQGGRVIIDNNVILRGTEVKVD